jgi:hypothetical protein
LTSLRSFSQFWACQLPLGDKSALQRIMTDQPAFLQSVLGLPAASRIATDHDRLSHAATE